MLLPELQGGSPPCNSLQRNPLRPGFSSGTSAIITISPGMASCTAAGRRTRSGHTPRAGTITVWVFATRADWMSEVFPLIPAPTPSVVPCSISCGSYAVITRQRISWDITNSAPISARLAPASTRRKNMRNCIRLRDI